MGIVFNTATGQYRDTISGRFVNRGQVLTLVNEETEKLGTALKGVARLYTSGKIDLEEFQLRFAERLKLGLIQAEGLGSGGVRQISNEAWGSLHDRILNRFGHLQGFAQDISSKNLTDKQILSRAALYKEAYRAAFYDGERHTRARIGFNQAKRWLDPQAQHCRECFIGSTLIETNKGEIPICNIQVGDKVLTRNGWQSVYNTRSKKYSGQVYVINVNGKQVKCTPEHPFLTERGWIVAKDLKISDRIMTFDDFF